MKKLITKIMLLLGVFTLLGAGQSYAHYWSIASENLNNWNPAAPGIHTVMMTSGSGDRSIDLTELTDDFKIVKNITDGNGAWWCGYNNKGDIQFEVISKDSGSAPTLSGTNDNRGAENFHLSAPLYNVKVTFSLKNDGADVEKVKIEGYTKKYPDKLYLVGENVGAAGRSNWGKTNAVLNKTNIAGEYKWTGSYLGNEFKVTDDVNWKGEYNIGNSGGGKITPQASQAYGYADNGGNFSFIDGVESVSNPTVTVNIDNKTITVTGTRNAPSTKYTLRGNFTGTWNNFDLKDDDGNGIFTSGTIKVTQTGNEFGIRYYTTENEKNDENNAKWYAGNTSNYTVLAGVPFTCTIKGNNSHNLTIASGKKYRFSYDPTNFTLTATEVPTEITWKLHGQVDGTWRDYPFIQDEEHKNIWTVSIPGVSSGEFGIEKFIDGEYDTSANDWYAQNGTLSEGSTLDFTTVKNVNAKFSLDPQKIYTLTWDTNTQKLTVEPCNVIYIYGHINGGSWDRGNYTELYYDSIKKLYVAPLVYIMGKWNERDKALVSSRNLWDHCGDENYVAFYPQVQTDKDFDRNGLNHMKFGFAGKNQNVELNKWYDYLYRQEATENNFIVPVGYYQVEFDAINHRVRFIKVEETIENGKIVKTYSWYSGDDSNDDKDAAKRRSVNAEGYYTYKFNYGDDAKNVVQVALYSNPKHDAARQADFTVRKKKNTKSYGSSVKRNVNEDDYETIQPGTDYRIQGSSDYDDNTLVHLYGPGEYLITAEMNKNAVDEYGKSLTDTYIVNPSSILVTVAVANLTAESSDLEQPFPNTKTGVSIHFSLWNGSEQVTTIDDEDISATLAPLNNAEGWPTEIDALPSNIAVEYRDIASVENNEDKNIDGVYTAFDNDNIVGITGSEGSYTATLPVVPCSGVYVMTITSSGYDITPLQITIYPNVLNTYYEYPIQNGASTGANEFFNTLNVNGVTWKAYDNDNGIAGLMEYPMKEDGSLNTTGYPLNDSRMFTPGLYFADLKVNIETSTSRNNVKREANQQPALEDFENYYLNGTLDLTALNTNDLYLNVYASKNGAYAPAPEKFLIQATKGAVATGVEAIGEAEDGEAVYFNLQGVKVTNPDKGIYVKVQNGKASKVVL